MNEEIEYRIRKLEESVAEIQSRNVRVEIDKAWETSFTRKAWLITLTYALTALVFFIIAVDHFLLNAIIPTIAYYLSTLYIPLARSWWLRRHRRNMQIKFPQQSSAAPEDEV